MKIKAIIFDFDGVITDTEPVHMEAWLDILEHEGIAFDSAEYHANYLGLNDRDFLDAVGRIHGAKFDDIRKHELIEAKTRRTFELLEHQIPLIDGVADFIEKNSKDKLLAICSGATRGEIEFILKRLKWEKVFDPIIASDSVVKGKPDPEGYIRATEGLIDRADFALLPENVIAIEDSPKGIQAAKAAGLYCIGVGSSFPAEQVAHADLVVSNMSEIEI